MLGCGCDGPTEGIFADFRDPSRRQTATGVITGAKSEHSIVLKTTIQTKFSAPPYL